MAWDCEHLPNVEAELLAFPGSPVKDQVDASSSAFLALQGPNVDNRNGVEIGIYSSGREDIGGVGLASPDAGVAEMHGHSTGDEANDGFGDDGFNVRGSLF